jgi:hypothetical protein
MSAETLNSAAITDRLGFSSGAFWAFARRLFLPRQRRNNGNAHVAVDVAERPAIAACSQEGDQSVVATLTARITTLKQNSPGSKPQPPCTGLPGSDR